jgi:Uma2 family endonuclease
MSVTAETYRRLALEDPEGHWELHHGRLREKPSMSFRHNDVIAYLGGQLIQQLDRSQFRVRTNSGHLRRTDITFYIPDVFVIPTSIIGPERDREDVLEVYDEPLPLVVEVRSPSTDAYDVDQKIPEYQRRGDLEIWRVHPFERTVTAWRRQPDGTYTETVFPGGRVQPIALPNVTIDFDALFAM